MALVDRRFGPPGNTPWCGELGADRPTPALVADPDKSGLPFVARTAGLPETSLRKWGRCEL